MIRLLKSGTAVDFDGPKIYLPHVEDGRTIWRPAESLERVNQAIENGLHVMAITEKDLMTKSEELRFNW